MLLLGGLSGEVPVGCDNDLELTKFNCSQLKMLSPPVSFMHSGQLNVSALS